MTARQPFAPAYGSGQTVAPAVASATVDINGFTNQLMLTNTGANICHIRISGDGVAATVADYPIPAGAQVVISKPQGPAKLSHISALGTTLHIMNGEGF